MRYSTVSGIFLAACLLLTSTVFAKSALNFSGKKGQEVRIENYIYSVPSSRLHAFNFSLASDDARRLRQLMQANIGEQLEFKIGSKVVMTPVVREAIASRDFEITVSDSKSFEDLKAALLAKNKNSTR